MRRGSAWMLLLAVALYGSHVRAQEAQSGLEMRASSAEQLAASSVFTNPGVDHPAEIPGLRTVLYPTVKFSDHWTATAAWQLASRPYFYDSFSTSGHGVKGSLLQGTVNYSRVSDRGMLLTRVGEMSTAFGAFLLRYDDAENPLVDVPPGYGYYYAPVSSMAVAGAQLDASRGKWDGRVQFANSSPANPRSLFAHDQYGNWAGGAGLTVRQGFRVGVSGYRGPYLARDYPYFRRGEANPNTLLAHAVGVDSEWARGHWNIQGEFQRFVMPYSVVPAFHEDAGYVEVRRVLHPRWYVASRTGYTSASFGGNSERFEFAGGFRPGRLELIKADYELTHRSQGSVTLDHTFTVQFVTTLRLSRAFRQ